MKPLEMLNNIDLAKLLFDLVPEEIPELLNFMQEMYQKLESQKERTRETWDNGFLSFDSWLQYASNLNAKIERYGAKLTKQKGLFADQLFEGFYSFWTRHCVTEYALLKTQNKNFKNAVTLLFNREKSSLRDLEIQLDDLIEEADCLIYELVKYACKYQPGGADILDTRTLNLIWGKSDSNSKDCVSISAMGIGNGQVVIKLGTENEFKNLKEFDEIPIEQKLAFIKMLKEQL